MKAYLDSSFVFSLCAPDDHSPDAISQVRTFRGALFLSTLTELELLNALELRVFRGELERKTISRARQALEDDLRTGVFAVVDLGTGVFDRARKLVLQTTSTIGCRTADILHVAIALENGADALFTFNERQKTVARAAKLRTN